MSCRTKEKEQNIPKLNKRKSLVSVPCKNNQSFIFTGTLVKCISLHQKWLWTDSAPSMYTSEYLQPKFVTPDLICASIFAHSGQNRGHWANDSDDVAGMTVYL